jgi:hypothetical protein
MSSVFLVDFSSDVSIHPNIQKDIAEFGSTFKNETHQNIESMWQPFKTEIKFIIDKRVPTKMTKPKHTIACWCYLCRILRPSCISCLLS